MKERVNLDNAEIHTIYIIREDFSEDWDSIDVEFDDKEVANGHFSFEYNILFLEHLNLKVYGLDRKGIGTKIMGVLEDKFYGYGSGGEHPFLFLVQFDKSTGSDQFYYRCGFKDFESSDEFSDDEKKNISIIIDEFCGDYNILYKKLDYKSIIQHENKENQQI